MSETEHENARVACWRETLRAWLEENGGIVMPNTGEPEPEPEE